jgi:hypothetical protein
MLPVMLQNVHGAGFGLCSCVYFLSNPEICVDNQGIVWEKGTEIVWNSVHDNLGTGWELCTVMFKNMQLHNMTSAAQYDFIEFCIITCHCKIAMHLFFMYMSLFYQHASRSLFYSCLFSHGNREVNVDKSQSIILLIEL